MKGLSVSRTIPADPERLWDLLISVDAWPDWGPTVSGAELVTPTLAPGRIELGSRGWVRTSLGPSLPFEVTRFESALLEPERRWSWTVAGIPATEHTVRAVEGGTVVSFGVPLWAPGYLAVCSLALRRLDRLAT